MQETAPDPLCGLVWSMGYYPILDHDRRATTRMRRGSSGSAGTTSTGASDAEFGAIGTTGFRVTRTLDPSY
jgi:hypothetical protein